MSLRFFVAQFLRLLPALAALGLSAVGGRAQSAASSTKAEPGLLFYLSGEKGTTADVAAPGTAEPNFVNNVEKIADGAKGAALECADSQRLAFVAPGNIYAQRGTLSFFWRSRYPVGPTEFPIFRVAFADHSSWDLVWLRIDYNGHGFDAFVTDANLSRVRISTPVAPFPAPKAWTHLAIAWDETRGIRFYVNGKLAAENKTVSVLNIALDQFGPHSRIISPYQVQSDYNFVRGGDVDEIRIYDRALADANIATLAKGDAPALQPLPARTLADNATRDEWFLRYGFNRPNDAPPALPAGKSVAIRKVEIHDAFDLKRWWWKANDGIRETTWPGVYNRSRLTGRHDYFTLPDWDCYVDSGKAVTFALPNEPWNHLEIAGSAWGKMELLPAATNLETAYAAKAEATLFERPKAQEKTVHTLTQSLAGRKIRFTNVEQEEPIGELAAYNVTTGAEPAGSAKLSFRLSASGVTDPALAAFIAGRFAPDERTTLVALPANISAPPATPPIQSVPLVHILIPDTWDQLTDGLDGIAIDLPALKLKPTHGALLALNIQVKDPLWPMRDMLDFTFSVKPDEAKTLWLDLRDRILPAKKGFLISIAGAGADFNAAALVNAELRLVFKPRDAARPEHELDRFTQARDTYAMLVEEHPNSPKLNMWVRFKGDLDDLLRVNPDHLLGRQYAAAGAGGVRVPFTQPEAPAGVPLWAFRQVELLGRVKTFVNWYIDHRQSDFGDFGGGISDDVDLTNTWPGVALMGSNPEKIRVSLRALIDASYKNGMSTNGLATIQADELHSYEEGINCLAQNLILDFGSPRELERAMETSRGIETITGINAAGHRHIRSSYYSGTRMAVEDPWGTSKPYSYLVCQVPELLIDFNGNPAAKKIQLELADGLLAHRKPAAAGAAPGPVVAGGRRGGGGGGRGGRGGGGGAGGGTLPSGIRFADDVEVTASRAMLPWHIFWGAWKWTGDARYLAPILDNPANALTSVSANILDILSLRPAPEARINPAESAAPAETPLAVEGRAPSPGVNLRASSTGHFGWQTTGDKKALEVLYAQQIETCAAMEFINTEGSLWIDRVSVPATDIQRARLGGVALVRNALYPGHTVSWKFAAPASDQSVAILIPDATPTSFKVIAYNLETTPVRASMTGWNIDPGVWEIVQGIDANGDDIADGTASTSSAEFERSRSLDFTLPPRATTILTLKLKSAGTPYWSRPDLGIEREDITRTADTLRVRIHSLGSVPAPASTLVVRDRAGLVVASVATPALAAPVDLLPKTAQVDLKLPAGISTDGATIELDPDNTLREITTMNNRVSL